MRKFLLLLSLTFVLGALLDLGQVVSPYTAHAQVKQSTTVSVPHASGGGCSQIETNPQFDGIKVRSCINYSSTVNGDAMVYVNPALINTPGLECNVLITLYDGPDIVMAGSKSFRCMSGVHHYGTVSQNPGGDAWAGWHTQVIVSIKNPPAKFGTPAVTANSPILNPWP